MNHHEGIVGPCHFVIFGATGNLATIKLLPSLYNLEMGGRTGPAQDKLGSRVYGPGETITLPPGVVHRMEAVTDSTYLEASTPEMDDVVRLVEARGWKATM